MLGSWRDRSQSSWKSVRFLILSCFLQLGLSFFLPLVSYPFRRIEKRSVCCCKSSVGSYQQQQRRGEEAEPWLAVSLKPENFFPGLVLGFLLGLFIDLSTGRLGSSKVNPSSFLRKQKQSAGSGNGGEELKMVLIVRQDLKMGTGKIASQCAHAAIGMYAELMQSQRSLLRQWEQCGQAKIVLTCKNQQEMNKLKEAADHVGLPTFVVADAGRTQLQCY